MPHDANAFPRHLAQFIAQGPGAFAILIVQKFFRPAWWTDLCFFLGQYLLWGGLVFGVMLLLSDWIDAGCPNSNPTAF